jgi:hypothetical protein
LASVITLVGYVLLGYFYSTAHTVGLVIMFPGFCAFYFWKYRWFGFDLIALANWIFYFGTFFLIVRWLMPRDVKRSGFLRRLQFLTDKPTDQELRRGALWSAAFVFGILAISLGMGYLAFGNNQNDAPMWFNVYIFTVALPLAPGLLVARAIKFAIEMASTSNAPIIVWIGPIVGLVFDLYLYFLIFSLWISWRNRRRQQRAAAEGA